MTWERPARRALLLLALVGAVFALSRLGLAFIDDDSSVTSLWPLGGFTLGVSILASRTPTTALVGAFFAGNLLAQLDARGLGWLPFALAAANALEPLIARSVLVRVVPLDELRQRPLRSSTGLILAAIVSAVITASIGTISLVVHTDIDVWATWASWALADGLGMLVIAPVLVPPTLGTAVAGRAEQGAIVVVVAATTLVMFASERAESPPILRYPFLLFPGLLWAAMRGGTRVTAVAIAVLGTIGAIATVDDRGPFAPADLSGRSQILVFQAFLAVAIVTASLVGSTETERRLDGMRLERERERFASVLRAATEYSVIATDPEGRITVFNQGAERMLGYRAEDVVGHTTPEPFHVLAEVEARARELGLEPGFEVFVAPTYAGAADTRTWTYVRRDGSQLQVSLTVTAIVDQNGHRTGFIGIANDITSRQRAERELIDSLNREREMVRQLREQDERRRVFLTEVSHELRTPLTSVAGYAELLTMGDLSNLRPDQHRALEAIDRNSHRLLVLINDLLTLDQLEADQIIDHAPVDVAVVAESVCELALAAADRANVRLTMRAPQRPVVLGDAAQLDRAITNLVSNAVKYTPAGGEVSVTVDSSSTEAVVAVTDTGVGIPDDEVPLLFGRYFRSSLTGATEGNGLGLAIVESIVQHHGGRVEVVSTVGAGSTFSIRLPITRDRAERTRPTGPDQLAGGPTAPMASR